MKNERRNDMDLQSKVIEYLEENGIKKSYLASQLGIYNSRLSDWLCGKSQLTKKQLKQVEKFIAS